jgi:hypothetical protein
MSYPSDILLPINAKYLGFVDPTYDYNSHWDITWSFTYALSGTEHAFCTFLTTNNTLTSGVPGQYLGYLGNYPYILTETGEYLLGEDNERLLYDSITPSSYDSNGILAIAFDSTGYFALSNTSNTGVSLDQIKKNSLIIRSDVGVVFNEALSSLDTNFTLASSTKDFKTIRIRLANAGKKLSVDYKHATDQFKNLVSLNLSSFNVDANEILYPAFTYCSPVSSASITPSKLWLKNFHTQGNNVAPTYETSTFIPLTSTILTNYTTISGISANLIY